MVKTGKLPGNSYLRGEGVYRRDYLTGSIPICPLFLRSLSFYGITKRVGKYLSQISIIFKNLTSYCTIVYLNFVLGYFIYLFTFYGSVEKDRPILISMFLLFPEITVFIFTSENSSLFVGNCLYIP